MTSVPARRQTRVLDPNPSGIVAAAAYLFPVLIFMVTGLYHVHFSVVWLGGVLGVIAPDGLRRGWHLPQRWRAPLVCWAGGVLATMGISSMLRSVKSRNASSSFVSISTHGESVVPRSPA